MTDSIATANTPQGAPGGLAPHSAPQAAPYSAPPKPIERDDGPAEFVFTGSAGEYFRIWIVNVALSVLTLGIYSAWAKVRTKQYFYRHTWLQGKSFDYVANPINILKGRIIIVVALGALALTAQFSPTAYVVLLLALMLCTPWVLVKALSFNARNSVYRNVRLSFRGTVGGAYKAYLIGGLVYVCTLGLGAPYLQWRISQFAVEGHRYGNLPFRFRTRAGQYFEALILGGLIALVTLGPVLAFGVATMEPDNHPNGLSTAHYAILLLYPLMLIPAAFLKARIANLFWGGIVVDAHHFESTQTFRGMLWLQATNVLAVIFSLGLALPWVAVRNRRYHADHLRVHLDGPLLAEAEHGRGEVGAFGDAATDLGDFGFDFG